MHPENASEDIDRGAEGTMDAALFDRTKDQADWDLDYFVSQHPCDVQSLDIETPAIDECAREDRTGGVASEALESGLSIRNSGQDKKPGYHISDFGNDFSLGPLPTPVAPLDISRPDRDIRACLELFDALLDCIDFVGMVGVGEEDEFSLSREHPGPDSRALAAVTVEPDDLGAGRLGNRRGAVGRAVVDNEIFDGIRSVGKICQDRRNRGGKIFFLHECGDKDRESCQGGRVGHVLIVADECRKDKKKKPPRGRGIVNNYSEISRLETGAPGHKISRF